MKRFRFRYAPTAAGILLLVGLFALISLDDELALKPSLCPFRQLVGIPCPGCGMTRAIVALYHGDLRASLACNPLGLTIAAIAAAVLCAILYDNLRGRNAFETLLDRPRLWQLLAICYTGYYLCRIVPLLLRMLG